MVRPPDDFEEDVMGEIRPDRGIEVLHIRDFELWESWLRLDFGVSGGQVEEK